MGAEFRPGHVCHEIAISHTSQHNGLVCLRPNLEILSKKWASPTFLVIGEENDMIAYRVKLGYQEGRKIEK